MSALTVRVVIALLPPHPFLTHSHPRLDLLRPQIFAREQAWL